MATEGVKFVRDAVPTKVTFISLYFNDDTNSPICLQLEKQEDGRILVTYDSAEGSKTDVYDTVVFAIGRDPCTAQIGIEAVGVELDRRCVCSELNTFSRSL